MQTGKRRFRGIPEFIVKHDVPRTIVARLLASVCVPPVRIDIGCQGGEVQEVRARMIGEPRLLQEGAAADDLVE